MKAGFFETDITPPHGMEKPGGYGKAYVTANFSPLKAHAAVFDDGERRVALVGVDTCVIGARTVARARAWIEKLCGIEARSVMIAASHTHTGGPLFGAHPDDFADAPEDIQRLALKESTIVDPLYEDWAVRQIAGAVSEADRRKAPARLSFGSGDEAGVARNRRVKMKRGRVVTHPGKGNPDNLDYAGPIDPEVGVVAAWAASGRLMGCVVNYTCHLTTFGGAASSDYAHFIGETIRRNMKHDPVVVFLNGACGDVTQVDNLSRTEREFGEKVSRRLGTRVGAEALKVMVTAEPGEDVAPVEGLSNVLEIPRRVPSESTLARSREIVARGADPDLDRDPAYTFAKEKLVLEYMISKQPIVPVEVQAIQVGPTVFLSNPAEYFCRLGLDIKAGSPFDYTYVVELANGGVGYVPDEAAFRPDGGGYETVLTSYSNLEITAGRQIADACVALARQLEPGAAPIPPMAPPFEAEWDYGVMGPELE